MKRAKEWVCSKCGPLTQICKHLEALLPDMRDGDHPQYMRDESIACMTMNVFQAYLPQFSKSKFQELMRNYGFVEEWDVTLLTAKYFYGMSDQAITDEYHYTSRRTTNRRLKELRTLLEERGFEQELE